MIEPNEEVVTEIAEAIRKRDDQVADLQARLAQAEKERDIEREARFLAAKGLGLASQAMEELEAKLRTAEAQVERLREALKKISGMSYNQGECYDVADDALKGTP